MVFVQSLIRQNIKQKFSFRFRTEENAFQICIPNQCILAKILLNIELKRLWRKSYHHPVIEDSSDEMSDYPVINCFIGTYDSINSVCRYINNKTHWKIVSWRMNIFFLSLESPTPMFPVVAANTKLVQEDKFHTLWR